MFLTVFLFGAWTGEVTGQTTVDFTVNTSYYETSSVGGEDGSAGIFDALSGTGLGMFASWESGFTVNYRELKVNGDNTGAVRNLQVGDKLTIVIDATTVRGETGFALVTGVPSTINFDNRRANSRLSVQQTGLNNQYFLSDFTSGPANFDFNSSTTRFDYTFEITKTSQSTVNVRMNANSVDYNNFDIVLGGDAGLNLSHIAIWLKDDWNGTSRQDVFAKDMAITNSGSIQVGYGLTGTNTFTPGLITDGLAANSTSTVSSNSVLVGGESGTKVIFNQNNSYTGSTTINTNATLELQSDLINSVIKVQDGATLEITGDRTVQGLVIQDGGTVTIDGNLTVTGTLDIAAGNTLVVPSGSGLNASTIEYNSTGSIQFNRSLTRATQTVEEVEQYRGWRLLSSPATVPFSSWLSGIWTQGGTGADYDGGTPNVFASVGSTSGTLVRTNITEFNTNVTAGQGYAVYVYESDFGGANSGWPKTLSFKGAENAEGTAFTPTHTSGTQYAIAGNPFSATIQFDNLTRGADLADKVWVYDPATDNVIARTDGSGDFNGLITPFQGFWIEYDGPGSTLTFPAAAKSSGGTFYAKEVQRPRLVLDFNDGTFSNSAWITFDHNASQGYDQMDAVQFAGMSGIGAQLYTIVDDKSVDINFMPAEFDEVIEYPLGYYTSLGGSVNISVRELQLPGNVTASIVNTVTGEVIELNDDTVISFDAPMSKRNPADENSLVASAQSSEFKLRFAPPTSTSSEIASELPAELSLSQNFPNPFNPTTTISFSLPVNGQVRLAVYNTLGQQIAELVNGEMSAGTHTTNFDASSLSSGVYVYRIEAAGQVLSKRMTLVK